VEREDDEYLDPPLISKTDENFKKISEVVRKDRGLSIRLVAGRMSIDKKTIR